MQGPSAHIDFETRSATDLRKSGVYRYAEDPTTWPWGFCWRIGALGPVYSWEPGDPDPVQLLNHIREGGTVACHNAAFERTIWNWVLMQRICPHWPPLTIRQQDCTMSRAAAIAHPQSLDGLGTALGTSFRKDMQGHALMMKMARPRRFNPDGSITWWDDRSDVLRNLAYCAQDVEVESEADAMLPPLSDAERAVWEYDQLINERGVCVDVKIIKRAAELVAYSKKQNDKIMRDLTQREVPKCSNDKKILEWLNARGIAATSLAKGEVGDVVFVAQAVNDHDAQQVIKLRQASWKTSTAKYVAMMECVSSDNRIRGMLNYHGASTGRWAGRLVQPQNLKRVDPDDEYLQLKIKYLHDVLGNDAYSIPNAYEMIALVHGPLEPMDLLSNALRSMFIAAPGMKLVGGDFSNIEGRVNAWLAGEAWKLQAFRDYDNGTGPDLYKLAYARSFGVHVDSVGKGPKRQIGKVQELALGYQGAIGAFITMGATYGLNPFTLSGPVMDATTTRQWDETAARYHVKGTNRFDLYEKEWVALKVLVDNWRAANSCIVQSWWNYQDAAIAAVDTPGTIVYPDHTRAVYYYSDGRCLWCVLPSGRLLCYAAPQLHTTEEEYVTASGETRKRFKRSVSFEGVDGVTKQWRRTTLYGGLQCENIVQAVSRDVMVEAMFRVEAAGYPVILTVHDEILAEVPENADMLYADRFAHIMANVSNTYDGLPVSVGAWEDKRYVK